MGPRTIYSSARPRAAARLAGPLALEAKDRRPDSGLGISGAANAPIEPLRERAGGRAQHLALALLVAALAAAFVFILGSPKRRTIAQKDIDSAVKYSLDNSPTPPSTGSVAYQAIEHAVVKVEQLVGEGDKAKEVGVGTGVVITEDGLVVTNFHVIAESPPSPATKERLGLVFADGTESDADLVSADPDRDIALLKARQPPDELEPATFRSISGLKTGDEVFAVGFPFGIGPSLSGGVVSGLNRSYISPIRGNILSGLIQFDAAANPGNSGGPLVDRKGDVVGLVSSILNPGPERVFIGIAFAIPFEAAARGLLINPF